MFESDFLLFFSFSTSRPDSLAKCIEQFLLEEELEEEDAWYSAREGNLLFFVTNLKQNKTWENCLFFNFW